MAKQKEAILAAVGGLALAAVVIVAAFFVSGGLRFGDSPGIKLPPGVEAIQKAARAGPSVGDQAPDFSVQTANGKTISLSNVTKEKPVVVYFWATWCPTCKADFEALKPIYPEFSDKLKFIAIDLDLTETAEMIAAYQKENGYQWDAAPGSKQIILDYNALQTSTKVAVLRDGKISYRNTGEIGSEGWRKLFSSFT